MRNVTAVLSMLHESPEAHSATRLFRGGPVLWWTLERLGRSARLGTMAVLCWEDQLAAVEPIAAEQRAAVLAKGPRSIIPQLEAISAAARWSDGWRGGLLATCAFDRGFHAPWIHEIAKNLASEAVLLIDPAAGLVDPALVDRLIEHAEQRPALELCFSQAAPGLSGAIIRPALLGNLAAAPMHPGRLLHYMPEQPVRDPIGTEQCVPVPAPVARTSHRFTLDSSRQLTRLEAATIDLNGQLLSTDAERLVAGADAMHPVDPLPREVVLELNTNRRTRPVHSPGRHLQISREALAAERLAPLFDELAAMDDVRLSLAGVGDPLLADSFPQVVAAAKAAGIAAIHVETDLLGVDESRIALLAETAVDVVSIHIPATSVRTYEAVMGIDGFIRVLENLRLLVERRAASGRGVPLVAPVFTKCRQNLGEMEAWYDQWLRAVGSAVIVGPGDFGGLTPDMAMADMAPPRRRACARLSSRMMVLCDGRVVSCEQDVTGRQVMGRIWEGPVEQIWRGRFSQLRADHICGEWARHAVCSACRDWHRP